MLGHPAVDEVRFTKDSEPIDLAFLDVVKGKDLQALQGGGLIGLAPIQPKADELSKPLESGIAGFVA